MMVPDGMNARIKRRRKGPLFMGAGGHKMPDPILFGTLVTADDVEHDIGNVLIRRNGSGILLDADMVLADDSTHPIFEAP